MSFMTSIKCLFGSHRPDRLPLHEHSLYFYTCADCGRLIASDTMNLMADRWWGKRITPQVVRSMSMELLDKLRAAKLIGLHPPLPRRGIPKGCYGGPLPEGCDTETEAGRAKLQDLLPKGATSSVVPPKEQSMEALPACKAAGEAELPPWLIAMRDAQKILADLKARTEASLIRRDVKDQVWSHVAATTALLGTCCRLKVGCVLVSKDGRVVGTGYNGAGPGMPHCVEDHCNENCRCGRTLHAEQNALFNRSGEPHTAYVTHEPCLNCTKELAVSGVRRVVYAKPYTSIADLERKDRQEWIDFYGIEWMPLPALEEVQA